jgi:hypothetical protein
MEGDFGLPPFLITLLDYLIEYNAYHNRDYASLPYTHQSHVGDVRRPRSDVPEVISLDFPTQCRYI